MPHTIFLILSLSKDAPEGLPRQTRLPWVAGDYGDRITVTVH